MRKPKRLVNENLLIQVGGETEDVFIKRLTQDLIPRKFDTIRAYDLIPFLSGLLGSLILATIQEGELDPRDAGELIEKITLNLEEKVLVDNDESNLLKDLGLDIE